MTRQVLESSGAKTVTCPCCPTLCERRRLKSHILTHIDFPYRCSQCLLYFKNKTEQEVHTQEKHGQSYYCKFCGKTYSSIPTLKTHIEIKHSPSEMKTYTCTICKKMFPTKGRLKVHMIVHSDERPFTCERCGTSFKYKDAFQLHKIHIHEGIPRKPSVPKSYTCEFCAGKYASSSALKEHILAKHTEKAVFKHKCNMCDKSFLRAVRLESHLNKEHFNRKPYLCSNCGKGFYIDDDRKRHLQRCVKTKEEIEDGTKSKMNAESAEECMNINIGTVYGKVMESLQEAV